MLARLRSRLTYANVVATLALFVALSTGGAYAANTIFSTDIVDGEVKTPDIARGAVVNNRLARDAVTTEKVKDEKLTGADVLNGSITGVDVAGDTFTYDDIQESTLFYCHGDDLLRGRLCARSMGNANVSIPDAATSCAGAGLRLPTLGEAITLAINHDVPGVGTGERFWTDEIEQPGFSAGDLPHFMAVDENGDARSFWAEAYDFKAVCVEYPNGLP